MPISITKEYTFHAAHSLTTVPAGHQCSNRYEDGSPRSHGHTYRVVFELRGDVVDHRGFIMDYGDISAIVNPFVKKWLDHHNLNESLAKLQGFNEDYVTTAENIAQLLYFHFHGRLPGLYSVTVCETDSSSATFWRER